MTNHLTQKQINYRAYYAKHAEAIRAQKRAAYAKTAKPRTKATPRAAKSRKTSVVTSQQKEQKTNARRKIEDILLAKELGIHVSELQEYPS